MYLANIQNQLFSAALPLKPLTAWAGSACSVTVAVPPAQALAGLGVSSVGVTISLPDGHTVAADAVQLANTPMWVATFAAENFATSGHVAQGLTITVAGTDEHGVVRTWIVAKGDLDVLDGDAAPVSGGSYYAVKLRDAAPDDPVEGDAYVADNTLNIYSGGEWVTIGGDDVVVDESIDPDSPNPVRNSAIAAALGQKANASDVNQALALKANASDVNAALAQKASLADLPYRLVEPGEWEFSGEGCETGVDYEVYYNVDRWYLGVATGNPDNPYVELEQVVGDANDLSVDFVNHIITATRPSLPGHLCDRAGNRVVVSGDTTLTLPAAVPGYLRDFLVRLEISGSTVPTVTIQGQGDEDPYGAWVIGFETDGDVFPVPDAEGTWLYSFTETAEHTFAVSLKKVNAVAQGGS